MNEVGIRVWTDRKISFNLCQKQIQRILYHDAGILLDKMYTRQIGRIEADDLKIHARRPACFNDCVVGDLCDLRIGAEYTAQIAVLFQICQNRFHNIFDPVFTVLVQQMKIVDQTGRSAK